MKRLYDILAIMLKYDPDADVSADHDIIYVGGPLPGDGELTPEDAKRLEDLRCRWDDSTDSWVVFV